MATPVIAILVTVEVDRPLPPCFSLRADICEKLVADLGARTKQLGMPNQITQVRVIKKAGLN
jgi:hypothetical protein